LSPPASESELYKRMMKKIVRSKIGERLTSKIKEVHRAQPKPSLSVGEKFWEEYLRTPYTNDRVGQAFIITHYRPPVTKEGDRKPDHEEC